MQPTLFIYEQSEYKKILTGSFLREKKGIKREKCAKIKRHTTTLFSSFFPRTNGAILSPLLKKRK
ncbi:hypothetical protein Q6247_26815, partial [Klebsiella pneumoniae]